MVEINILSTEIYLSSVEGTEQYGGFRYCRSFILRIWDP